jgi:uncharacterized membrane protein YebE (DUF533 family)
MKPLSINLDAFNPQAYLRALIAIAAVDGVHPLEEAFIRQQATAFGVDPEPLLASSPVDLTEIARGTTGLTRRMIYRDCFMLTHADGIVSEEERAALEQLRGVLELEPQRAVALEDWVRQYSALLALGEALLSEE